MRTAAIIPTHGGETGLDGFLDSLLAAMPAGDRDRIVVVADPAEDGVAAVARRRGAAAVAAPGPGYGRACLAGIASLAASPPDIVVFLDADGRQDPGELPALLAPLRAPGDDFSGEDFPETDFPGADFPRADFPRADFPRADFPWADFVVGSRVRGRPEPGAHPAGARLVNRVATFLIRLRYGYRFTDLGPFRAIRWKTLARLGLRDPDYGWTVEMLAKAARARVPSVEVPVSCRRPEPSRSSPTFAASLLGAAKVLLTVLSPLRGSGDPGLDPAGEAPGVR